MKRIIPALILLFLCIGICVYGSVATDKKTHILLKLLDETEYSLNTGNTDKALDSLYKLESEWEKHSKFFSSVSETALIDELDISVSSIDKYVESDMLQEAMIIIEECRAGLETVHRRQKISFDNIL